MTDLVDEVIKERPLFLREHAMNAYLAFIRNSAQKGIYVVNYISAEHAKNNDDYGFMYLTDKADIQRLSEKIDMTFLHEVYDEYDECMQVVLIILIAGNSFLQVELYSPEDSNNWGKHLDCQ